MVSHENDCGNDDGDGCECDLEMTKQHTYLLHDK